MSQACSTILPAHPFRIIHLRMYFVSVTKKKPYGERGGVTVNTCNNALNTSLSSSLNAVITKHRIVVILFVFER